MKTEIEIKFQVSDFDVAARRLKSLAGEGGEHSRWHFEGNIVLDDQKNSLGARDWLLRLRTGLDQRLTLKLPAEQQGTGLAKHRLEYEIVLDDAREAQAIFRHLGFDVRLRYEKFRQEWRLDEVTVCLDILPFGRFVEIEGPEDRIAEVAPGLGLDMAKATSMTYHELNRKHISESGLEPGDDFVFDLDELRKLGRELGVDSFSIQKKDFLGSYSEVS